MHVVILIPFRSSDARRDQLLDFTRCWLDNSHTWPVILGESPEGPFNRAAALNDAARRAGDWDYAVVYDADTVVPARQLTGALQMAQVTGRATYAFSSVVELGQGCTDDLLGGEDLTLDALRIEKIRTEPLQVQSSALVVPRAVWDTVGGFDEQFRGWGGEDNAFHHAVSVCCGAPGRIPGHAFHLWHEPGRPRHDDPDYRRNQLRWQAYKAARTPERIKALTSSSIPPFLRPSHLATPK